MKCTLCPAASREDRTTCAKCSTRKADAARRLRARLLARGLCVKCCRRPLLPGKGGRCLECAERNASQIAARACSRRRPDPAPKSVKPPPAPAAPLQKPAKPQGIFANREMLCFRCRTLITMGARINRRGADWMHHACPPKKVRMSAAEVRMARALAYWDAEYKRVAEKRAARN